MSDLTYAIGDIHGQLDKLRHAQELIAADRARSGNAAPVVHLGDLVDRGPDSRGVVAHLMAGQARGENWVVLKGNHDRMLLNFLADPETPDPGLSRPLPYTWKNIGGADTLDSYGVPGGLERPLGDLHAEALRAVPQSHRDWLASLPLWHRRAEALFVHAGIRPGIALAAQTEDDLIWIRGAFLDDPRDHGFLVVHGHSAIDEATHYGNRLNLDTKAGYGGPVTAAVIEGRRAWRLTEHGREEIAP
jgi:serine/threonine protein phosphatase 1